MHVKAFFASLFTIGMLSSFVLVVCAIMLYFLNLATWPFIIGFTIAVNIIMWLISPWISDWIYKSFYNCTFYTYDEIKDRPFAGFLKRICESNGIKMPKIGIIKDQNPTAFTYGSTAGNARIVLTEGLFHYCDEVEVNAVVAHEVGHIVHRDFIVMTVAATLLEILYEIYVVFARRKNSSRNSKGSGLLVMIGLISYFFYWIGTYLVLFLSRTREYCADFFAADATGNPNHLSSALIKIAYGIAAVPDTESTAHLLNSTRALGIFDFKAAKDVGLIHLNSRQDVHLLENSLLYDIVSPWATIAELTSTHPLPGKRIRTLSAVSRNPAYNFEMLKKRVDYSRLWRNFGMDASVFFSTHIASMFFIMGMIGMFLTTWSMTLPTYLPIIYIYIGIVIVLTIIRIAYMFPGHEFSDSTVLACMGDIYASPVRGKPVILQGKSVGKGIPGFVFGEDMMFKDSTGLIYLNFESLIPIFGNLFFSWKRVEKLHQKEATATGWFFRSSTHHIALRTYVTADEKINSYVKFWSMFGILAHQIYIMAITGLFLFIAMMLAVQTFPIYDIVDVDYKTEYAQGLKFDVPASWEEQQQPRQGYITSYSSGLTTTGILFSDPSFVMSMSIDVKPGSWDLLQADYEIRRHINERIEITWRNLFSIHNMTDDKRVEKKAVSEIVAYRFYFIQFPVFCNGDKIVMLAFKGNRRISDAAYAEVRSRIEQSVQCV